jgi:hypothetical protein
MEIVDPVVSANLKSKKTFIKGNFLIFFLLFALKLKKTLIRPQKKFENIKKVTKNAEFHADFKSKKLKKMFPHKSYK